MHGLLAPGKYWRLMPAPTPGHPALLPVCQPPPQYWLWWLWWVVWTAWQPWWALPYSGRAVLSGLTCLATGV